MGIRLNSMDRRILKLALLRMRESDERELTALHPWLNPQDVVSLLQRHPWKDETYDAAERLIDEAAELMKGTVYVKFSIIRDRDRIDEFRDRAMRDEMPAPVYSRRPIAVMHCHAPYQPAVGLAFCSSRNDFHLGIGRELSEARLYEQLFRKGVLEALVDYIGGAAMYRTDADFFLWSGEFTHGRVNLKTLESWTSIRHPDHVDQYERNGDARTSSLSGRDVLLPTG